MAKYIYEQVVLQQLSDGSFVIDYRINSFFSSFEKCYNDLIGYFSFLKKHHDAQTAGCFKQVISPWLFYVMCVNYSDHIDYYGIEKHVLQ